MHKGRTIILSIVFILILVLVSVFIFRKQIDSDIETSQLSKDDKSFISNIFKDKDDIVESRKSEEKESEVDNTERIAEIDRELSALILINSENGLSSDYIPTLADLPTKYGVTFAGEPFQMIPEAATQLDKMLADAASDGHIITIYSAYRSYTRQQTNYLNKVNQYLNQGLSQTEAEEKAATIVNPPGKSEHQSGLSADICTAQMVNKYGSLPEEFETTDAYKWLLEHCADYGFILRYPKNKEAETGITFEPWHYRYVGVEYASKIMDSGLCFEEYIQSLKDERAKLSK